MKIKDQVRARREQLGVTIEGLAKRVGVSHQAVRHWEAGRSFPGKSKAPKLEEALSFRLDWTEGVKSRLERPDITSLLDQEDIDILLVIRKLPASVKKIIEGFARAYMDALEGGRTGFTERSTEAPVGPFAIRESDSGKVVEVPRQTIKSSTTREDYKAKKRTAHGR